MKNILLAGIFIVLISAVSIGQNTETRPLHEIKKLHITGKTFNAQIIPSDVNKIELSSTDLTMDKIVTTESNGELKINVKGIFTTGNVICKIYCTSIPPIIEIDNGAYLKTLEPLTVPQMNLITNSDGYIHLNLITENLSIQCNSGGDLTLEGSTKNFTASANTNGTVRAEQMQIDIATAKAYLGAEIYISAKTSITTVTGTNGKVHIYKPYAPSIVETNETGGQTIRE